MDDEALYQLLVELMEKLSIKVVCKNLHDEEFRISGGLCKIRGKDMMIIDKRSPLKEQIANMTRALARHDLDDLFIPPFLRDIIDKSREEGV